MTKEHHTPRTKGNLRNYSLRSAASNTWAHSNLPRMFQTTIIPPRTRKRTTTTGTVTSTAVTTAGNKAPMIPPATQTPPLPKEGLRTTHYLKRLLNILLRNEYQAAPCVSARRRHRVRRRPRRRMHPPSPRTPLTAFRVGGKVFGGKPHEAGLDRLVRAEVQSARWHRSEHGSWDAVVDGPGAPGSGSRTGGGQGEEKG